MFFFVKRGWTTLLNICFPNQESMPAGVFQKMTWEKLAKATKGRIVSNLSELTSSELGNAETVEELNHGEELFTYVRGCQNPKALTILIHGGTEHVMDEIERGD